MVWWVNNYDEPKIRIGSLAQTEPESTAVSAARADLISIVGRRGIILRRTIDGREYLAESAVVPDVHRLVGRFELLRRGPGLQGFPGRLEFGLG
jgi:hypothetical protein